MKGHSHGHHNVYLGDNCSSLSTWLGSETPRPLARHTPGYVCEGISREKTHSEYGQHLWTEIWTEHKGEGRKPTEHQIPPPVLPDLPREQAAHPATVSAAPVAMLSNSMGYILKLRV